MITVGDEPSTLRLVQVLEGIGLALQGETDPIWYLDIAQWEAPEGGPYFCELQDKGECDSSSVSWGTSDPYEPKFCSKHYFDAHSGYEFVEMSSR
jgi:hypothetical protein